MSEKHTLETEYFVSLDDGKDVHEHDNSGLAMIDTGRASEWPIARLCEWPMAKRIVACLTALHPLTTEEIEAGAVSKLVKAAEKARILLHDVCCVQPGETDDPDLVKGDCVAECTKIAAALVPFRRKP